MTVISDLESKIAQLKRIEAGLDQRIKEVPSTLSNQDFNRRLNDLDEMGCEIGDERRRLERLLDLIQRAVREETAAPY